MSNTLCPCCSNLSYAECCQPYHNGDQKPETCEQLMRSRYSAYFLRIVDYLVRTTHPSKLRSGYKRELESHIHDTQWTNLQIINTSMGSKKDKIGKVEFIAYYIFNDKANTMQEHSRFKRFEGKWTYLDGNG